MKFLIFLFVIILLGRESLAESEEEDDCSMRAFKMVMQFLMDVPDNMATLLYQKTAFDPEDARSKCKSLDQFNANVKNALQTLADCPDYHLYYKIRSLSMSFVCSLNETNAKCEFSRQIPKNITRLLRSISDFYKLTDNKLQKTCVVKFQGYCTDLGLNFCK